METIYESIVMHYLTHLGDTFICPQFPIKGEGGGEWAAPDFVALNFARKEVQVVEVTVAYDLKVLQERIRDRHSRWFSKLQQHLSGLGLDVRSWRFVAKAFVREDRKQILEPLVAEDVSVDAIEGIVARWKWTW